MILVVNLDHESFRRAARSCFSPESVFGKRNQDPKLRKPETNVMHLHRSTRLRCFTYLDHDVIHCVANFFSPLLSLGYDVEIVV